MENKQKIFNFIEGKGRVTSSELIINFGYSRQYINTVISELLYEKKIIKLGKTRNAFYVTKKYLDLHEDLIQKTFKLKLKNSSLEEHVVLNKVEEEFFLFSTLPENIKSIFTFAFSEMLNNAIEHSQTKNISIEISIEAQKLSFKIKDTGIGVFRNIMEKRKLKSETEAIQDLLKGKTTTMPRFHSGEGIFFTSRSSDMFVLDSFGTQLIVETSKDDIKIKKTNLSKRGTEVFFEININSNLHLNDVFKRYTNLTGDSDFGFDKTEVRVSLYMVSGVHISRSQARRILSGLEKFKIIVLDFEKVPMVGQAFADEIYRVFKNKYPNIIFQEENMSEGVKFMIERSKNEAKL